MNTTRALQGFMFNEAEIRPGQEVSMTPGEQAKFARLGFVEGYETKVMPAPQTKVQPAPEKKTVESLPAAPAAPASQPRKSKKRTKKVL